MDQPKYERPAAPAAARHLDPAADKIVLARQLAQKWERQDPAAHHSPDRFTELARP